MPERSSSDLLALDRDLLWHPYTSLVNPTHTHLVTNAEGVQLELAGVGWVLDAMSSWWSAIHGYRHPRLDHAVTSQVAHFSHVMFGGLTHEPAIELGLKLTELSGLDHVFFADSGSVSVEVALKMAIQYQRGVDHPERTKLLTVAGGYHGDTLGCMSVCDPVGGMHSMFSGVVPQQYFGPRPPSATADAAEVAAWETDLAQLASQVDVAAIIVEPLLQGAGGMYVYPASRLRYLRELADQQGLLLIADEIATGFGRLGGNLFACHQAGIQPDIMCVGKALTGGYLTLAATLCTQQVARGIGGSESGVLMHGPTYMANPLACATALASLELLENNNWRQQVANLERGLKHGLAAATELPGIREVRTVGGVGVIELDQPVKVARATEAALGEGVWVRPFRNLIYAMPPYLCTPEEVDSIAGGLLAAAKASL